MRSDSLIWVMDSNNINIKQVLSRKNNIDQLYEINSASVQRESHILTIQPMQNIFYSLLEYIILKPTGPFMFSVNLCVCTKALFHVCLVTESNVEVICMMTVNVGTPGNRGEQLMYSP